MKKLKFLIFLFFISFCSFSQGTRTQYYYTHAVGGNLLILESYTNTSGDSLYLKFSEPMAGPLIADDFYIFNHNSFLVPWNAYTLTENFIILHFNFPRSIGDQLTLYYIAEDNPVYSVSGKLLPSINPYLTIVNNVIK